MHKPLKNMIGGQPHGMIELMVPPQSEVQRSYPSPFPFKKGDYLAWLIAYLTKADG